MARVVVVEKSDRARSRIRSRFLRDGHEVVEFDEPEVDSDILRLAPDAVLLSCPDADEEALRLLGAVRAIDPTIPIVAIVGSSNTGHDEQDREATGGGRTSSPRTPSSDDSKPLPRLVGHDDAQDGWNPISGGATEDRSVLRNPSRSGLCRALSWASSRRKARDRQADHDGGTDQGGRGALRTTLTDCIREQ